LNSTWLPSPHLCDGEWYDPSMRPLVSGCRENVKKFQIFIKMSSGKSTLVWVYAHDSVKTLKVVIEKREGLPRTSFYILHAGKVMHDDSSLIKGQISKNSTITLLHLLRGGAEGKRGPTFPTSYKEATHPKGSQPAASTSSQPSPYIVEKLDSSPILEIKHPQVKQLFSTLQSHAVICRFNGFWPRYFELHQWVYSNWTTNSQILLCSKGFFVVQFESQEEYQKALSQGP